VNPDSIPDSVMDAISGKEHPALTQEQRDAIVKIVTGPQQLDAERSKANALWAMAAALWAAVLTGWVIMILISGAMLAFCKGVGGCR